MNRAQILPAIVLLTAGSAAAQTPMTGAAANDWQFKIIPYLWAANLDGEVGINGLPESELDASFDDLLENLDFAASAFFLARKGEWMWMADVSYTALDADTSIGPVDIDLEADIFWTTLAGGYRVAKSEKCSIDLFGGLRYVQADTSIKGSGGLLDGSKKEEWLDPLVGVYAETKFSGDFGAAFLADIGGFGVGSDLTYELLPSLTYQASDLLSIELGYRWMSTDYEDDDFVYDIVQSGFVLGVGFAF